MDPGDTGNFNGDLNSSGRLRMPENIKVYTRRSVKKSRKSSNNNKSAIARSSSAENRRASVSAAVTTSQNCATTGFSSVDVAAPKVSTPSTSEDPNESTVVDHLPINHSSTALAIASHGSVGDDGVQESLEALGAEDAGSSYGRTQERSPYQGSSPPHISAGKDDNSSLHQLQDEKKHQNGVLSPSEDIFSTPSRERKASGDQTAELQNIEDSPLPNTNETEDLERQSPLHNPNEVPPASSGDAGRELPPLPIENGMPNGTKVAAAELRINNETCSDGSFVSVPPLVHSDNGPPNGNGVVKPLIISRVDDRVRFNLSKATPKNEIEELRKKLKCELDQVSRLVKQLEAKELQLASCNTQISNGSHSNSRNYIGDEDGNIGGHSNPQLQHARISMLDNRALMRWNSNVDMMGHQESRRTGLARVNSDMGAARNLQQRSYSRQLSVAVMESNYRTNEFVEKEKRTPKANQYYKNSEFLLGKDRLPPESNKRMKTSNARKHNPESGHAFGFGYGFDKSRNQVFKSCSSLLQRLMKHKYSWVFNEPVNAKALGLVDYHDVINHPMDFGTIKTRLSQNQYKSPSEFAEDVRLVFRNAMTYNPKGQDVHVMAEQLSQIFEERWAIIETDYNPYRKYQMYPDAGPPTPTSRKPPRQTYFCPASFPVSAPASIPGFNHAVVQAPTSLYAPAAQQMISLDRPETMLTPMSVDPKIQRPYVSRTPVPKKPKAKDPNKRDMTYDEKQKLSTNLQSLSSEKLDAIVQIIKRRSTALSQHDDEIEVDIDNVDTETLWELDRFVTNYRKSLSKNKRKAELALQARMVANQTAGLTDATAPGVAEVQIENGTDFQKSSAPPLAEGEKQNGRSSSSSSSSSSDSGSSSSDSDSDTSSADGSDGGT